MAALPQARISTLGTATESLRILLILLHYSLLEPSMEALPRQSVTSVTWATSRPMDLVWST